MLRGLDKKNKKKHVVLQQRMAILPASGLMIVCASLCTVAKKKKNERLRGSLRAAHAFAGVQLPPCALIRVARGPGHASAVLRSTERRWRWRPRG